METTAITWQGLLERHGISVFLVLFMCAVIWKLLPHMIEWFKTTTHQAEVVSEAVPDIRISLKAMAQNNEAKLNCIEARTGRLEEKTERILEKLNEKE